MTDNSTQSDVGPLNLTLTDNQGTKVEAVISPNEVNKLHAALTQSDAGPPQDVRVLLERCRTVLGNMALENEGALFNRWPIHHEPLRSDARSLLPLIDAALAQSDAAWPKQWRERDDSGNWTEWQNITAETDVWYRRATSSYELRAAICTAPPRPDVSGLIEAAELCRTHVAYYEGSKPVRLVPSASGEPYGHLFADAIEALRSRAADRSGK